MERANLLNSNQTANPVKKGKIIVFSAASGAGKTTILDHVRRVVPQLVYSISVTTRKPRRREKNGVHYFFIGVDEFKNKIDAHEFAEWALVHGNYYGTPRSFIDASIKAGKHVVMDIDVYGKIAFDKVYPEAIGIFIKPPSSQELERRLRSRGTESDDAIKLRLANAVKETGFAESAGKYEYTVINDDLEKTKKWIVDLVRKITG